MGYWEGKCGEVVVVELELVGVEDSGVGYRRSIAGMFGLAVVHRIEEVEGQRQVVDWR